jgi:hypothetical protein
MNNFKSSIFIILASVFLSMFGAAAKEVSNMEEHKDNDKFNKKRFVEHFFSALFIASFIGLVVGLACLEFGASIYLTLMVTGLSGWVGKIVLDVIFKKVWGKFIGGEQPTKKDNNESK